MKKLIMIILFCMILLFATNESSSQCANCIFPSSQESFQMEIPNTSCTITVNYCLTCSPTGNTLISLCSVVFPYTSNCFGIHLDEDFFESVRQGMAKDGALKCANKNGIPIGPCPNRAIIETYLPTCARWEVNTINSSVNLVPCFQNAGLCYQQWEICFQDPDYIVTPVGDPFKISGICISEPLIFLPELPDDCFEICQ